MTDFDCHVLIVLDLVIRIKLETVWLRVNSGAPSHISLCPLKIFRDRGGDIRYLVIDRHLLGNGECYFLMSDQLTKFRCVVFVEHRLLIHGNGVSELYLMPFLMTVIDKKCAELRKLGVRRIFWLLLKILDILLVLSIGILDEVAIKRTFSSLISLLLRIHFHF